MKVKKRVKDALDGIQASFARASTVFPRVRYFEYLEQPELFEDGLEDARGHYIQVDVFSRDNATSLIDEIMVKMEAAGFDFLDAEDLSEDDAQVYQRTLRFFYLEERGKDNGN